MVKDFDLVGQIMRYESGELDEDQIIQLFQHLLESGMVTLQGHYGRTAKHMLDAGIIHETLPKEEVRLNPLHQSLVDKLNPRKYGFSPMMAAILGCILEQDWVKPRIHSLTVTSDGYLLGDGSLLDSFSGFMHNLGSLVNETEGLTDDEKGEWRRLWLLHVTDWRTNPRGVI